MKLPGKIKILAHEYAVVVDRGLALESDGLGECNSAALKIRLLPGMAGSVLMDTLVHEVLEALNYHLALELDHGVITRLSEGLTAVVRDNGLACGTWEVVE